MYIYVVNGFWYAVLAKRLYSRCLIKYVIFHRVVRSMVYIHVHVILSPAVMTRYFGASIVTSTICLFDHEPSDLNFGSM